MEIFQFADYKAYSESWGSFQTIVVCWGLHFLFGLLKVIMNAAEILNFIQFLTATFW